MPTTTLEMNVRPLEERTLFFARDMRFFVKHLPQSPALYNDSSQILRASGSIGANYLEAKEGLSKKDFLYRIRICRKEAKEARYWLLLLQPFVSNPQQRDYSQLLEESDQLIRIFTAIAKTTERRYVS